VKDAKAEQKRLWEYYQKTSTQELFGPSSKKKGDPNYLFHTNYLQLTEKFREAYNEAFVPFWNKAAPDAWDTFDAKVKGTTGKPGAVARTKVKVDDLMTPVGEYKFDFEQARQDVKARYDALIDEEKRISRRLRDDPKLSKAGVRISVGARAMGKWRYYWESHLDAIDTFENDLINKPSDAEETVDAIQKALNPPFVPRDDKRVEPLP
jgi:hypothetical protein